MTWTISGHVQALPPFDHPQGSPTRLNAFRAHASQSSVPDDSATLAFRQRVAATLNPPPLIRQITPTSEWQDRLCRLLPARFVLAGVEEADRLKRVYPRGDRLVGDVHPMGVCESLTSSTVVSST